MEATKTAEVSEQARDSLEALKQRFEQWRGQRKQGERIPTAMWTAAVKEARARSVYRVARALRLDYAMLKLRAQPPGKARGAAPSNPVAPRFVELFAATGPVTSTTSTTPAALAAPGRPQCVVEMHNVRGAKMRVELDGQALAGLAGLCSAFWSA